MVTCRADTEEQLKRVKVEIKRPAKRMPTQRFGYLGSNGGRPDVVLHRLEIVESGERIDLVCCGVTEWPEDSLKSLIGKTSWRSIPVIVSTATLDLSLMMKVLDMGVYDLLFRPFHREQLVFAVRRALQHRRLKLENLYLRDKIGLGSSVEIPLSLLIGLSSSR